MKAYGVRGGSNGEVARESDVPGAVREAADPRSGPARHLAGRLARQARSSASPPACPSRPSSGARHSAMRIVRAMPNTPAHRGCGSDGAGAGRARDGGRSRHGDDHLRQRRAHGAARRIAARRGHRALRKRARVPVPDHRGARRRRREGRALATGGHAARGADGAGEREAPDRERPAPGDAQGQRRRARAAPPSPACTRWKRAGCATS